MTDITIYHNKLCSKSKATLAILKSVENANIKIINYLETPPSVETLKDIISKLGFGSARQLMRTGEAIYKTLNLTDDSTEKALLDAMACHPKLIERPIVIANNKAKIGRPPESVLVILS